MKGQLISVVRSGEGVATLTVRVTASLPTEPSMPQGDDDKSREARKDAVAKFAAATAAAVESFEAAIQRAYDGLKAGRTELELGLGERSAPPPSEKK